MAFKYFGFEAQGQQMRLWMESPTGSNCPIKRSTVDMATLQKSERWVIQSKVVYLADNWHEWADRVWFPIVSIGGDTCLYSKSIRQLTRKPPAMTKWIGRVGHGVIFADDFRREHGSHDPYMSEFMKSVYEAHFSVMSLKHVIFTSVVEKKTYRFVTRELYSSRGLATPLDEPQTWESPSSEFCGILGTPIGKVTGAFVLGIYGQGIKRIARIVTFYTDYALHMQFDLENVK
ncbi:unnamed protein product [Penicillium salamii]|nr:unnamed protein product [Penicillium salamii]